MPSMTTAFRLMGLPAANLAGGWVDHNEVTVVIRCRHVTHGLGPPVYSATSAMKATAKIGAASLPERPIREQIERIVSSAAFYPSDRLKHFITFVAGEALKGKADALKEYAIGVHVFGRETAFDPRTDPVVRVQARRLRARLEKYYREEGQHDEIVVDLPKGGYAPVFRKRDVPATPRAIGAGPIQQNTVAVQPVVDLTANGEAGQFCAGLTRELIRRLTTIKGLRVAAAPSGHPAAASMTIESSIRRAAEGLRLSVNLVNAASGCYECSDSMAVASIDTFAIQDQLAEAITERVRPY